MNPVEFIDRVTVTGADDSINPQALLPLAERFPFAEFGILLSQERRGTTRYPSAAWLDRLVHLQSREPALKLSAHLCGRWAASLLLGDWWGFSLEPFARIQFNTPIGLTSIKPAALAESLRKYARDPLTQIIFQVRGDDGSALADAIFEDEVKLNVATLFDQSGGRGIEPGEWPKPPYLKVVPGEGSGVEVCAPHGFAGGLSPENLEEHLPAMARAATASSGQIGPCWIDAESSLREARAVGPFSIERAQAFLAIAEPWVLKSARR